MLYYLAIPLTIALFFSFRKLYSLKPSAFLNPVFLTIFSLIAIILLFSLDYQKYAQGTFLLKQLLAPAIVALAIPLYQQLHLIKSKFKNIVLVCLLFFLIAFGNGFFLLPLFGVDLFISASFSAQSFPPPIAVKISKALGGFISLTASMVVFAGIIGSSVGIPFLRKVGVKDKQAVGLAIGCGSHVLGTAKMVEVNTEAGAISSVGLILCALFSAVLMPLLYHFLIL